MVKSSRFRGVTLFRPTGKWRAQISAGGKTTSLGDHDTEEEAARAFDRAAINKGGWTAKTNFDINDYKQEVEALQRMTQVELVQMLRSKARKSGTQTSIYRGVSLLKQTGKWHAQINVGGKQVHLGFFGSEDAAARAYDRAAINKGAREGGKIITNFDIADYSHELEVLRAITQEELISALSSESRRKKTMEMLAEGAEMSRAESIFGRKLTAATGGPTIKELQAKAERAVPKGMNHALVLAAPQPALSPSLPGTSRNVANAPSPSNERGAGRLPTDPSSDRMGTPSNYHPPDTPDHVSDKGEFALNKFLEDKDGAQPAAAPRGRQHVRTRGGKPRPRLRRAAARKRHNDSEETLTSEPSDKDSVFEFTDDENAAPAASDSDKSWAGGTPKRKRGGDTARGRRQHGSRSKPRQRQKPQPQSTPEPEQQAAIPPLSHRDRLSTRVSLFKREAPGRPSPPQSQQQQAMPQTYHHLFHQPNNAMTPPRRSTQRSGGSGFPSPMDQRHSPGVGHPGLASPLDYHQGLGPMQHPQGGLSPLDNHDPLALPAFPGRSLAMARRLLEDELGFPGASNPSSPLSSNRGTPTGSRFSAQRHGTGAAPSSQLRNSSLRSLHSIGRNDMAALGRLLSNPSAAMEQLASAAYGEPGTPYGHDQLQQLLRYDSLQALRDYNQLDKILQPLADEPPLHHHPSLPPDDPLDLEGGLMPREATSMLPPGAPSPLRPLARGSGAGLSPGGNALLHHTGSASRLRDGGSSLKRSHSEASSLDGGAVSSQGKPKRRSDRRRSEVWRCPALFEGDNQQQQQAADGDELMPLLSAGRFRTDAGPSQPLEPLSSLLAGAALQLGSSQRQPEFQGSLRGALMSATGSDRARSLLSSLEAMLGPAEAGASLDDLLRQDSLLPLHRGPTDTSGSAARPGLYRADPLPHARPGERPPSHAVPHADSADDEAVAGLVELNLAAAGRGPAASCNGDEAEARRQALLAQEEEDLADLRQLQPWPSGLVQGREPVVSGMYEEDSGTEGGEQEGGEGEGGGSGSASVPGQTGEADDRPRKRGRGVAALRHSASPQPSSPSRASGKKRRKLAPRRAAL